MEFDGFTILLIVCVVGGTSLAIWQMIRARRYHEALMELLQSLRKEFHLNYEFEGDEATLESLGQLPLFDRGWNKHARHMVWGPIDGLNVAMFQYLFFDGTGDDRSTYSQTVVTVQSDALWIPAFELSPEGLLSKVKQAAGFRDIDFRSHPEFSKRYVLKGIDVGAVRETFSREVLDFFEKTEGLSVEAAHDKFVCFREGKTIAVDEIRPFMDSALELARLFVGDAEAPQATGSESHSS